MESTLQLSVKTLEWAANKNGSSLPEFARTLYTRDESVANNITRGALTFVQMKKFAERAKVPFGFLFLPEPPPKFTTAKNLVDFRTVKNNEPLSDDFLEIYKDVEHKQTWYKDYLISIDEPKLEFVGKYRNNPNIANEIIAADIRRTLDLENIEQKISPAYYYDEFAKHCESAGVLVFKNSVVVTNNRRSLNANEFRGFVIADDYAPAVFINADDSKKANIFTLAHELAHVWLGESGISDADTNSNNQHEVKCNAIAAEILVPKNYFLQAWDASPLDDRQKITKLNRKFKVSDLVIARVALTNKKISPEFYRLIQDEVEKHWRDHKAKLKAKEKKGGPPQSRTAPIKNSRRLNSTVLSLVRSHQMALSEASILLNVNTARILSL